MSNLRFLLVSDLHGNVNALSKLVKTRINQTNKFSGVIISGDFPATIPFILVTEYILRWRNFSRFGYSSEVYNGKLRNQFVNMQLQSIRKMVPLLQKFKIPLYYIPGNVETKDALYLMKKEFTDIAYLEEKPFVINNKYIISGTGGSLEHLDVICDHEYTTENFNVKVNELRRKIEKEDDSLEKIFVFHEPPRFNRNPLEIEFIKEKAKKRGYIYQFPITAGSDELLKLIYDFNPIVSINGHYHEYAGKRIIKDTVVINPGPLATYNYAIMSIINRRKRNSIKTDFFKIKSSGVSFINFLYQKRSFIDHPVTNH
ncbi:MAG: metallophosphoesterase family protein [Candidatus Hodarchaeales archaeon]